MDELNQLSAAMEYMVRGLVDHPEAVKISMIPYDGGALYRIVVDPADHARVVGQRGVTLRSLRVVLRALGEKLNQKLSLEIDE
jgi:predicted RNA-binding protein YlqC (UPF0109 family)